MIQMFAFTGMILGIILMYVPKLETEGFGQYINRAVCGLIVAFVSLLILLGSVGYELGGLFS